MDLIDPHMKADVSLLFYSSIGYTHFFCSLIGGSNRYDKDDNETNFLKRPPPKTTLMDFMTTLKISNDTKPIVDNDNQKLKDRYEPKRRNPEQYHKTNNGHNNTMNNSNHYYQMNNYPDQIVFQQDGINEQLDSEDDPSHSNYRERRNPLPPRYVLRKRKYIND